MDGTKRSRRGIGNLEWGIERSESGSTMPFDPEGRPFLRFAANVYGRVSDRRYVLGMSRPTSSKKKNRIIVVTATTEAATPHGRK